MLRRQSSEWGWSKILHWLRQGPELRPKFVTALEHCDMVAATLCGVTDPNEIPRSVCAMGHKWMWNPKWGGLPPEEFLTAVDPCSQASATRSPVTTTPLTKSLATSPQNGPPNSA